MPRVEGAKNVVPFADRSRIATTATQAIKHLAKQYDATPLKQFHATLENQQNYLNWIDSRHNDLLNVKKELNPKGRGPKDAIYRKYRWYAEQTTLLEAINAYEVFYKNTFVGLASALRRYIPPERINGSVDAKVLWTAQGKTSFTTLILEHHLYHDLEQIDKISNMLINKRRYSPNSLNSPLRHLVVAIQGVFQVRHTLSHNQGHVTQSDKVKLQVFGYEANKGEVIDPNKDYLGRSIRDLLRTESSNFTVWLLESCAEFLKHRHDHESIELPKELKKGVERLVGSHSDLDALPWS